MREALRIVIETPLSRQIGSAARLAHEGVAVLSLYAADVLAGIRPGPAGFRPHPLGSVELEDVAL